MAVSALPAFVDAFVTMVDTAVSVTVYDGPQVTDEYAQSFVGVGWDDGSPDGSGTAAEVDQRWGPLGALRREETGQLNCVVSVWSGDSSAKGRRDAAYVILGQIENAMRADPTITATCRVAELTSGNLQQTQENNGVRAVIVFTVTYQQRI